MGSSEMPTYGEHQVEQLTPKLPDAAKESMTEAEQLQNTAAEITVNDDQTYNGAAEFLRRVKGKKKELEEQRKAITKPMDDAKKRIMDLFRRPIEALDDAENRVKRAMLGYDEEQRRIAEEKQRKAEEEAERERRRAEKKAQEHDEKGNEERAEAWRERAEHAQPTVVGAETPKAEGVSTRKVWKGEVTDMKALCKAIADGQVPARLVQPNNAEIGKFARALQDDASVPGMRFWSERTMAARS